MMTKRHSAWALPPRSDRPGRVHHSDDRANRLASMSHLTFAMIFTAPICPSLAHFLISMVSLFSSRSSWFFSRSNSRMARLIIRLFSRRTSFRGFSFPSIFPMVASLCLFFQNGASGKVYMGRTLVYWTRRIDAGCVVFRGFVARRMLWVSLLLCIMLTNERSFGKFLPSSVKPFFRLQSES